MEETSSIADQKKQLWSKNLKKVGSGARRPCKRQKHQPVGEENGVPKSTACRWAQDPAVRIEAQAVRRRMLNRVAGTMIRRCAFAAGRINALPSDGQSESVQLNAAKLILTESMRIATNPGTRSVSAGSGGTARDPRASRCRRAIRELSRNEKLAKSAEIVSFRLTSSHDRERVEGEG